MITSTVNLTSKGDRLQTERFSEGGANDGFIFCDVSHSGSVGL